LYGNTLCRILQADKTLNFLSRAPGEHTDHVDLSWEEKKFLLRTAPVLSARQQHTLPELLENPDKKVSEIVNAMNGV